ncbi:PmoA family protein [Streptomyces sp. NBC_01537]|uniref:DUF6807 domain-containing protein n=1 Tax=Streptomyces sp. NBC_01537 TaxID=2903896 RepID=UPI00386A2C3E
MTSPGTAHTARTFPAERDTTVSLRCAGRTVGRYTYRPELPDRLSPRPYLHPLTTLGGTPVTAFMPDDHGHHLGVSMAVPDVDGRNFWGGRTYVPGQGPTELDNHGVQTHRGWLLRDPDGFVEELSWRADGRELLRERRTVAVRLFADDCWALDFTSAITNASGRELSIGSPATNGRPGAGYGGFFWRTPAAAGQARVFTADADGEDGVHGRTADWLALSGAGWTLVFAGATGDTRADPWFVRTAEYAGVGSSLAWAHRLPIGQGETVTRRIATAVADGRLGRDEAASLVHRLTEGGV